MAGSVHGPHRADVPPPYGVDHQRVDGLPPRPPGEGPRGVRRADVQGPPPLERGELHGPHRPRGDDVPVDPPRTPEGGQGTEEHPERRDPVRPERRGGRYRGHRIISARLNPGRFWVRRWRSEPARIPGVSRARPSYGLALPPFRPCRSSPFSAPATLASLSYCPLPACRWASVS